MTLSEQIADHIVNTLQEIPNDPDAAEEYIKHDYKQTIWLMRQALKALEVKDHADQRKAG